MISSTLLMRLAVKEAKLKVRVARLSQESAAASAAFVEAVQTNASREVLEAARLRCVSVYEMQLDVVMEAAENERAWKEATRG